MKRGMRMCAILGLFLALGGCLAVAACEKDKDHVHSYGDWTGTEATCTEDGTRSRTCTVCGETESETVPALGHSWDNGTIKTAPTCTETGVRVRKCTRCGTDKEEELPANGHDWDEGEELEPAGCTTPGKVLRTCNVCFDEQTFEIPAKGHTWNWTEREEPDCEHAGLDKAQCAVCGTEQKTVLPALGHKWRLNRVISSPTCTDAGRNEQICDRCQSTQEVEIAALGHNFEGRYTVDIRPSFDHPGEKSYHCTRCNVRNGVTVIPQLEENTPIEYEFRIQRNNGDLVLNKGLTVVVKDGAGNVVKTSRAGETASGVFTAELLPKTYTVTLADLPEGYFAGESYTVEAEYPYCTLWVTNAPVKGNIPAGMQYKEGDVMYDFTLTTVDNTKFTLSEELAKKKGVIINFFFVGCQWCGYEFPGLNTAYLRYRDDITVIAIDPYAYMHDSEDAIRMQIVNQYSLAFPVALDTTLNLQTYFNLSAYPASVFIDGEGVITKIERGSLLESDGNGGFDSTDLFLAEFAKLTADSYWKNPAKKAASGAASTAYVLPVRRREF